MSNGYPVFVSTHDFSGYYLIYLAGICVYFLPPFFMCYILIRSFVGEKLLCTGLKNAFCWKIF
jgi:hypothetical protein